MIGDYLHLERRSSSEATRPALSGIADPVRARLGEQIMVPTDASPAFARITVRPSALGRLAGLLHKTSQLRLTTTFADGSTRDFRVISGMLGEGMLISPLVENTSEFALLLVSPEELAGKVVTSFAIRPTAHAWQWQTDIAVEFERVGIDARAGERFAWLPSDARVDVGPDLPRVVAGRCDGSIDVVNGSASSVPRFKAGRVLHALGWASASAQEGHVPEAILLALGDVRGDTHFFSTRVWPRPDVAAAYHRPELAAAGFETRVDLRGIEGQLTARIAMQDRGEIRLCPDARIVERY